MQEPEAAVLKEFWRSESGATSIEYALIAGFVSIMIVSAVTTIGSRLKAHYFMPIANNLS